MNTLVILGNGFDLAHKLKTTYNDFFDHYMLGKLTKANEQHGYEDQDIKIEVTQKVNSVSFGLIKSSIEAGNPFKITFKNQILTKLVASMIDHQWVDIEAQYYSMLKGLVKNHNIGNKIALVQKLNENMTSIENELIKYLHNKVEPIIDTCDTAFKDLFMRKFRVGGDYYPSTSKLMIVNFNYTSTLNRYLPFFANGDHKLIHIHGKLKTPENPIIFGFGDERDNSLQLLEDENKEEYLDKIKSIGYSLAPNYKELLSFIQNDRYEAVVIGHSCGLSDRTLLSNIFESDLCARIRVYYHEDQRNFKKISQSLFRHFSSENKDKMRERLIDFTKSDPCPQASYPPADH